MASPVAAMVHSGRNWKVRRGSAGSAMRASVRPKTVSVSVASRVRQWMRPVAVSVQHSWRISDWSRCGRNRRMVKPPSCRGGSRSGISAPPRLEDQPSLSSWRGSPPLRPMTPMAGTPASPQPMPKGPRTPAPCQASDSAGVSPPRPSGSGRATCATSPPVDRSTEI